MARGTSVASWTAVPSLPTLAQVDLACEWRSQIPVSPMRLNKRTSPQSTKFRMSSPAPIVGQIFEDRATLHYEHDTCGRLHTVGMCCNFEWLTELDEGQVELMVR
jgi:hypothetical protein